MSLEQTANADKFVKFVGDGIKVSFKSSKQNEALH